MQLTYPGCVLDESISGEPMAIKVVNKISRKLKFLHRKKNLTAEVRRMLCNALIKSHFGYACTAWHTNLTKKQKRRYKLCKISVYGFVLD